jgi:hypothetical protein
MHGRSPTPSHGYMGISYAQIVTGLKKSRLFTSCYCLFDGARSCVFSGGVQTHPNHDSISAGGRYRFFAPADTKIKQDGKLGLGRAGTGPLISSSAVAYGLFGRSPNNGPFSWKWHFCLKSATGSRKKPTFLVEFTQTLVHDFDPLQMIVVPFEQAFGNQ